VCAFLAGIAPAASGQLLSREFSGTYGQIEVGGPFAGAEFHRNRPLPSRISLYAPVANSIDLSTDYWRRDESMPLSVGVRVDGGPVRQVGLESWTASIAPHRVEFRKREDDIAWTIGYDFSSTTPRMGMAFTLRNLTGRRIALDLYVHLRLVLRSCHTYARFDSSVVSSLIQPGDLQFFFADRALDSVALAVQNGACSPARWWTGTQLPAPDDTGETAWPFVDAALSAKARAPHAAAYAYRLSLDPGDSAAVELILTCGRLGVSSPSGRALHAALKSETDAYGRAVHRAASASGIVTGDRSLDGTAAWAGALLETNAHALGGQVVPMPCPAEYNFFFTHDVLLTDLGAVHFDLARVRRDLRTIARYSAGGPLAHAAYWKDSAMVVERCTPDNWNHHWFILTAAAYLRHSLDTLTVAELLPLLRASIREILTQRGHDGVMHAFRPDWWDIGHRSGPRAYMTILTIRTLEEYLFVGALSGVDPLELREYEAVAVSLRLALVDRLWDEGRSYLMSYCDRDRGAGPPDLDPHFYMGSLLAAVYDLLPPEKSLRLVETARSRLFDPRLGVRTVDPTDFHEDSTIAYFRLVGREAGAPFVYANGGVWPHGTGWFVRALAQVGKSADAVHVLRTTMTIDGIQHSPMGQPAFFEYRCADSNAADYGKVDKPSFLWFGGQYFAALYRLLGVWENPWNLSLRAGDAEGIQGEGAVRFTLAFGKNHRVRAVEGKDGFRGLRADGLQVPSSVLPLELTETEEWTWNRMSDAVPSLRSATALVHRVTAGDNGRTLRVHLSSFDGHRTRVELVGRAEPLSVTLDGVSLPFASRQERGNTFLTTVEFAGSAQRQKLQVRYPREVTKP
jgi:hypothetical protein